MTDLLQPILGRHPTVVGVSNSEIQCYKSCRRKWWLAYYRGLKPQRTKMTGPLVLGTRVHGALESYYEFGISPVDEYLRLLNVERDAMLDLGLDTSTFDDEGDLGRIMLEGYLEWLEETGADSQLEVVGAEKAVAVPLLGGRVELKGKLDLRVRRKIDNVRLFVDHKTLANFDSITRTAHMSEQGMMYQLLEMLSTKEGEQRCDGLIYNMLRKVKRSGNARPPFYERLEVHFNKHTMRAFWNRLHGTLNDMLGTREALDNGVHHTIAAYPTPTQDCTWKCEFFAVCPLFDDGSAAEELIATYYTQDDPYQRYGEERTVA